MSDYKAIAERIRALGVYSLANMCEGAIDNDEARAFYEGIRDGYAEAIEYAEGKPDDDATHEIADGAPDIYNHVRMLEAIGTGAYLEKSELATGNEDMLTLAAYVLYDLAQDLLYHLGEFYDETAEELDDDTEDEDA